MDQYVLEGNKLIAESIGLVVIPAGTKTIGQIKHPEVSEAFLKYDISWDAWMDAYIKITKFSSKGDPKHPATGPLGIYTNIKYNIPDLPKAFHAMVEFLKWYLSQTNSPH